MGRHSHSRALNIWMNGEWVGQWTLKRNGVHELVYADSWNTSSSARPLSLSLPMTGQPLQGQAVENFFDNLPPFYILFSTGQFDQLAQEMFSLSRSLAASG